MFEQHNQEIREANRLRVRVGIPQRQTILMGASGPVWFYLAVLLCIGEVHAWDTPIGYITADDLQSLFGPDGCIQGVIVSMPTAPTIMPAAGNIIPTTTAKSNAHMLMASEGDNNGSTGPRPIQINNTVPSNNNSNLSNVANTKEKTPMCLVNELARFNKIQHQYRLTNEQGPAHKKRFTVTLKLGQEDYSAEGPSIKKAQHSAAADALSQTQYKHPPPKATKNVRLGKSTFNNGNITPTVELNALAMKRGEPAIYTFMEHNPNNQAPHQQQNMYITPQHNYTGYRGMYNQRYYNKGPNVPGFTPPLFMVSLRVGSREFYGEGPSAQGARHDAASKAVHQLKQLPLPDDAQCQVNNEIKSDSIESDPSSELKSPISLVHEIALKRNLNVTFEVTSEKGPPHMRTFTTRCIVGETVTSGEGNGKKISKKRAAEKMLDELKLLPPCSPSNITSSTRLNKRKQNSGKKKSRNLIKVYHQETKNDEFNEDINPISRLIQIQQAKKEREPVYTLIEERGVPRRREFIMEVSIGDHSSTGSGSNKKLAKRAAAEALLQLLGYSRPSPQPNKPSLKAHETCVNHDEKNRKVTFQDDPEKGNDTSAPGPGGTSGRQLVPGLLLMSSENTHGHVKNSGNSQSCGNLNLQTTATIAKELLNGGNSPTAEALQKNSKPLHTTTQAVRPKDQLLYLSDLLGFQVQFSDFPKGNHSEYLSLVSLSTDPPQVCHGAGTTTDTSHDQAALKALKALSEMGLDSVAPVKKDQSDGIHSKSGLSHQK